MCACTRCPVPLPFTPHRSCQTYVQLYYLILISVEPYRSPSALLINALVNQIAGEQSKRKVSIQSFRNMRVGTIGPKLYIYPTVV